jgi:hypothetical protein
MKPLEATYRFAELGTALGIPTDAQPRIERRYLELPGKGERAGKGFILAWVASYADPFSREIAIDDKTGDVVRDRR